MATEGGLLDIEYGMDPLSVLGDMPLDPDAVKLIQTEGAQQDLAGVATWLKNRELLVRGWGGRRREGRGKCMQGGSEGAQQSNGVCEWQEDAGDRYDLG